MFFPRTMLLHMLFPRPGKRFLIISTWGLCTCVAASGKLSLNSHRGFHQPEHLHTCAHFSFSLFSSFLLLVLLLFFFFLTNWIMFPASWGLLEDWDCLAWFSSLPLSVCLGHGWSPENAERWRKAQRSGLHKGRISGGCESLKTRWLWVQYLTAVWSWVNYLISLYLRFLTYKMRIILVCTT